MKKEVKLKPLDTTELEFKDREEFLKWREKILENYEKSKIDYEEEMRRLFGFTNKDKKDDLEHCKEEAD